MDYPNVITAILENVREGSLTMGAESEGLGDTTLPPRRTERGHKARNAGSWKRQGNGFSLGAARRNTVLLTPRF